MYILHLSDLHFGNDSNSMTWHSLLTKDLENIRQEIKEQENESTFKNPDVLIISGDIANKSTKEEYEAARKFVHKVKDSCHLTNQQIIIVPGNHDLNWDLCDQCYKQKDNEGIFSIEVDQEKYQHRFDNFRTFYEEFNEDSYPLDYNEQAIVYPLEDKKLLVLGLNSAWKLSRHETRDANINTNALSKALNKISNKYSQYIKIAVWHHPIDSNENDRITDDAFLQLLARDGFHFGLHGHIHRDNQERRVFRPQVKSIDILAAGTFGAQSNSLSTPYPWQYQLLNIEGNKLSRYTRKKMGENNPWVADLPYPDPIILPITVNP